MSGKRHPESRERGDERGVNGEKTHERASCEVRVLSSRRSPKEGVNGGENARTSFCEVRALSSPSKSRERGDEREVHGEKTE